LRSLAKRGVHTIAASELESPPAFSSRYADETHRIPSFRDDVVAYKDGLLSLAKLEDVRAIATFREMDVYVLSKYAEEFGEHVEPLWPDLEALRIAHDRKRLVEAAEEAGVGAPETQLLSETDDWENEQIVKDRYGVLTGDYIDGYAEEQYGPPVGTAYLEPGTEPDREALRKKAGHDPIVQEHVSGDEYAVWALYDRGEPVATCLKHQVRGFQYEGGTSVCRETVEEPGLEEAGTALLDHLDWHGPASVQMIRDDETGEFRLLEINPRFWVSLSCAVRAGLDFPDYFWRMANGEQVRATDEEYEIGVATHLLRGEIVHLHSVLRGTNLYVEPPNFRQRAWEVAKSCWDQPNFDYLTLDDPGPFVRDVLNTIDDATGPFDGVFSSGTASRKSDAKTADDVRVDDATT
jgi:predicted ATP-grasp superfamily ATP-dependent carboligase